MKKSKDYFMTVALEEAKKAFEVGEIPVGAVCVHNDEIIARGHNKVIKDNDPTSHAEIVVLREACRKIGNYRLKDVQFYVTVEPCPMCISALINARIGMLVFGAKSDKWGFMSRFGFDLKMWNHSFKVYGGIFNNESEKLLKDFFKDKRH
ncbi:MAG: nucleoside deaminase [Proteobacteria bacterium]|nr:nucleoside deaminase [Pseudomonadota bacterium]